MRINLAKLSRAEINALLKNAAARLRELEHETIGAFVADVKKRAEKAGIPVHEIAARLGGGNNGAAGSGAVIHRARQQTGNRSKVAAKYRHPQTGETWSGRGRKASWLAKEIAAGKKLQDFAVGGGATTPPTRKLRSKAGKRGKVAAKYRNAKTGDTWSGRGTRPRWLQAEIAAGKKIETFAVR